MNLTVSPSPATLFQNSASNLVGSGVLESIPARPGVAGYVSLTPDQFPASFGNASPTEISLQTNASVPYHFSAKELSCAGVASDRLGAGSIVFGMRASEARKFGYNIPEKSLMVSDYVGVNAWLKVHNTNVGSLSAEEIMELWNTYGCMKVKATSSNHRFRAMGTSVMNNVVGQRVSAANVWGEKAQTGSQLYFVLKKKKRENEKNEKKDMWTFLPYGCRDHATPPLTKQGLIGDDDQIGAYVFIGTATSEAMASVENTQAAANNLFVGGIDVCMSV